MAVLAVGGAICSGISLEEQGRKALKEGIPEVAAVRFKAALMNESLDASARERVGLLLVESWVRAGQFESAWEAFDDARAPSGQEARFWKGLALAGCGKFAQAEQELQAYSILEKAPYHDECLISLARVQANKGDLRSSLVSLKLIPTASRYGTRSKIDQCQIYMALGNYEDGRKVLPSRKGLSKMADFEVGLLDARLLLAEGKAALALKAFSSLRSVIAQQETGDAAKSRVLFDGLHLCIIGEARARHAAGKATEATDNLLAFVQNYPDSPFLSEAFADLMQWLPPYVKNTDDPVRSRVISRLDQWSPIVIPSANAMIAYEENSVLGMSYTKLSGIQFENLHAHALHARITIQSQEGESAVGTMRSLLVAMQAIHPNHPLTFEAWLLWAKNALSRSDQAEALRILEYLVALSSGVTQVNANLVLAREFFLKGEFGAANECFTNAANQLRGEAQRSALFNAAIATMNQNQMLGFDAIFDAADSKLKVELKLEQALFAVSQFPDAALAKLDEFLVEHATHKRSDEARIALAQCAMRSTPANIALAKSQLESVADVALHGEALAISWCQIFYAQKDFSEVASRCRAFLAKFPESSSYGTMKLQLGVALYQTGDYGDARVVLQELAAENESMKEPATLYAARAAARSGTPQSILEAGRLFDSIAASGSLLADAAVVEKARVFLDSKTMDHVIIAEKNLSELLSKVKDVSPIYSSASLLKVEALYALGVKDTTNYSTGLLLQQRLLELPSVAPEERRRILYYRGLSFEQLGASQDALNAYYEVIESATMNQPISWEYVDRCGFNALAILEKNEAWESAIAFAKKIAALRSPRAQEALERARRISLEHFIFDQ